MKCPTKEQYAEIRRLRKANLTWGDIAVQTGIDYKVIARWNLLGHLGEDDPATFPVSQERLAKYKERHEKLLQVWKNKGPFPSEGSWARAAGLTDSHMLPLRRLGWLKGFVK